MLGHVDRLIADRHFGMLVSYLRDDDKVYETYWTPGEPAHHLLVAVMEDRQGKHGVHHDVRRQQLGPLLLPPGLRQYLSH
jgi:hypothetical protein